MTAVVLATVAPVGLIACGDDDDDDDGAGTTTPAAETTAAGSTDIPEEFSGEFLQIRKGTPEAPQVLGAKLEAPDGTSADVSFTLAGPPPPPSGSAKCGGETFDQAATEEASTTGELDIDGIGTAALRGGQTVTVADGPPPPVCEERAGTWAGDSGDLAGRSGTFTLISTHAQGRGESTLTLSEE